MDSEVDEVLVKREQIRTLVKRFKRIGYSLMLISIVSVIACWPLQWPKALVVLAMVTFTLSCIILPAPIVFAYGIKAAEREDKKMGLS
jgi:hypothetical protein